MNFAFPALPSWLMLPSALTWGSFTGMVLYMLQHELYGSEKKIPAEKSPEIIEESGSKKSLMQRLIASMNKKASGMVDYVELAFDVHIKNFNDDAFSSKYKKAWNFIMEYDRKNEACAKHPVRL